MLTGEKAFAWMKESRETNPVYYDKDFQLFFGTIGTWHVFKYDDVKRVFGDYQLFSNEYNPKTDNNPLAKGMSSVDPPYHRKLRALASQAFTPQAINQLQPWIESFVDKILDEIITDKGELNVIDDLAIPIPTAVNSKLLGVPVKDQEKFKKWCLGLVQNPTDEAGAQAYYQAQEEMMEYFKALFPVREKDPQDDLISELLQVELDGRKLTEDELLGFCVLLLLAGNETTTNLISSTLLTFAENPSIQQRLADNPHEVSRALEEVMRLRSPAQYISRRATQDVELNGQKIKKDDIVTSWLQSANRDESVFPQADEFNLDRTNLNHIAFGHGIHLCLGAPLARIEAKIVIQKLLQRIKNIAVKPGTTPELTNSIMVYSLNKLEIIFDKK